MQLEPLLAITLDLTTSLAAADRYQRLLASVAGVIRCDAACLFRRRDELFVPVATRGLVAEVLGYRFPTTEHPRLAVIAASQEPVRFPADSELPDPFDGMVAGELETEHIHACLGCPLRVDGELVGALTLDAVDPRAFDDLDPLFLATLAALAGAAMRTSSLIEALENRAERQGMIARELLRESAGRSERILGISPAVERLRKDIQLVAATDLSVLITGESGVGKELVARAIHAASPRRDRPLIQVNCAALPENMAESELFGHERGAFTGAGSSRAGKFAVADGGTLLLDEIGELSPNLQAKLLRALQNGEVQRIGADTVSHVDVRVLAATNRDLAGEVRAGRFRADLYHRLDVVPLRVPPLRERRSDIAILAGHFCEQAGRRLGLGPVHLAPETRDWLERADWPGNVRELENTITRLVLHASARDRPGQPLLVREPELDSRASSAHAISEVADEAEAPDLTANSRRPLRRAVDDFQRRLIRDAVARNHGNWAAAARQLGLHRSNLHHLARRLGLR